MEAVTEARAISDGRAQLVADLIAVKALIDTPEKYQQFGSVWQAMLAHWHGDTDESDSAYWALEWQVPRADHHLRRYEESGATHADIMSLFDRAIKEASNG